ncbi:hypothetical protein MMR14E_13930 [Methylobacterium mesophilicum]
MSFTVVKGSDDHTLEDAVRRGVADGLARLLGVPRHPDRVQALLDAGARTQSDGSVPPARDPAGSNQNA